MQGDSPPPEDEHTPLGVQQPTPEHQVEARPPGSAPPPIGLEVAPEEDKQRAKPRANVSFKHRDGDIVLPGESDGEHNFGPSPHMGRRLGSNASGRSMHRQGSLSVRAMSMSAHRSSSVGMSQAPPAPNLEAAFKADKLGHPDTTKHEMWGWYMYDFANGGFFFSVLLFLPVLITSQAAAQARDNFCGECPNDEWARNYESEGSCYGVGDSCGNSGPQTNSSCVERGGTWSADWKSEAIDVSVFGVPGVGYASVSLMCVSISVVLQLVTFLLTGSVADYGDLRKRLFIVCNTIGACACLLLLLSVDTSLYWFSGLMLILGNVAFGSGVIFYNAFLPLLVGAHPEVRALIKEEAEQAEIEDKMQFIANNMSAKGFATGFTGQTFVLFINLGVFALMGEDQDRAAIRINCAIAGVWALVFSLYTFYHLHPRPSPPLPKGENVWLFSLRRVRTTFASAKELPQLFIFLFAYFIYSDGTGTIGASATIFATVELQMTARQIMYGVLMVSFGAVFSCFFFVWIQTRFGVSEKAILMFNLVVLGVMPVYAFVALTCQWEFYLLTLVYGLMFGSEQAFTRSIFSALIPSGHEAEYFALFEVTDKGTAWLGPVVVASVFSATGSFRQAFLMLTAFFAIGLGTLFFFDKRKGEAQRFGFMMAEAQRHAAQHEMAVQGQQDTALGEQS